MSPPSQSAMVAAKRRTARRALTVSLVGIASFTVLALLVTQSSAFHDVDEAVSASIRERCEPRAEFFAAITKFGNPLPVAIVTTGVFAALLASKRRLEAGWLAATVAGGWLASVLAKAVTARVRPAGVSLIPLPDEPSFPSGHATTAGVLFGSLALLAVRDLKSVWLRALAVGGSVFMILAIGLSRVVLGVHFLADVVAGWVLAASWLGLTTWQALEIEARRLEEAGDETL